MIERLKFVGMVLGNAAMLGFSLFQLYYAWSRGEIYFGSDGPSNWASRADNPAWFVAGVTLYGLASILFAGLLAIAAYDRRIERRNLQRWLRRPPLDNAVREPPDRGS